MSRIAYVNGRYLVHADARVHIEDRGYQFADGVYEAIGVFDGRLVDGGPHFDRLERSLAELRIAPPMARRALEFVVDEVIRRNHIGDGFIYFQVSRGVAPRNHPFPAHARPALVVTARRHAFPDDPETLTGGRVVTQRDIRWERCDIKSLALLPNVLAKEAAVSARAQESWMVDDDGFVTEGASTNAWIVDGEGTLVTRPTSNAILAGITRATLLRLAREAGIAVAERPFTVAEAQRSREAFISSTTQIVKPITQIDDAVVGNGEPGSISRRLLGLYLAYARAEARACA